MSWDYIYEEEHFDINGYCCIGMISNGKQYLFYSVGCDEPHSIETCRVYSSPSLDNCFCECAYEWTAENDSILLKCLNSQNEEIIFGPNSPLRFIKFLSSENEEIQ